MAGPTLFRPSSIPTGLQLYLKMDEASGARADSSGNGNNMTDNNTVGIVASDYWKTGENSALFVSASSEYLSLADASQTGLDLTGDFSIGGFLKPTSLGVYNVLFSKHQSSAGIIFYTPPGDTRLNVIINGSTYSSATGAVAVGRNDHVMCVKDTANNRLMLYVNGNLFLTSAGASYFSSSDVVANNAYDVQVGKYSNSAAYSDSAKKDIAVWNVALTPIQIKSLALGVDLSNFAYRPNNVSTAPTSWWKLNELSGNRSDSSGANTLTDNNTVTALGGYVEGVGADFELSNTEYLSVADPSSLDITGSYSIAFWAKPEAFSINQVIVSKSNFGTGGYWVKVDADGIIDSYNQGQVASSASALVAGVWQHIVITHNASTDTRIIYIDGIQNSSTGIMTTDSTDTALEFRIGRDAGSSGNTWDGLLADVAVWNGYVVTPAEAASLACGIPLQQTGIVSYWKLDEASGTRADSIGSNNLTDNNTVLSGAGKVSNAADFESTNSESLSITNASQSGLNITSDMSFIMWLNPESLPNDTTIAGRGWSTPGYYFFKASGGIGFNGSYDPTVASLATWRHYSGTVDGAAIKLFANSALVTNTASATLPTSNTEDFRLGYLALSYYDGLMDEVLLAKRWFRDEEIKTIYCKGLAGKELTYSEIQLGGNQVIWTL